MYVERILCPIVTLGPGKRLVIWTKGCSKKCPGCISPEMSIIGDSKDIPEKDLFSIVKNLYQSEGFDGITISGGDPLEQLSDLLLLLEDLHELTDDILVYTGFLWKEFSKTIKPDEKSKIEKLISVLIDGPYIHEKNTPDLPLRGSSNQTILFFDPVKKEKYMEYMNTGRQLQNIYIDDKLLTVGIMDK